MGFDPNGLDPLNQFALVVYIPGRLGSFLDDLRLEIAPGCRPHAHVTILPPRPITVPWETVAEELRTAAMRFTPFEITAGDVAILPVTDVIYLKVEHGTAELCCMHEALGRGKLAFAEPFPYHPHITAAQELPTEAVGHALGHVRRRWKEYTGPRGFRTETLMFVQNTAQNRWIDLAEIPLATPVRV